MATIRVGMSGWTFEGWRGTFYPKGLAQKRELEYASRQVNSIEINGTFYSLQKPTSFQNWYLQTPEDFQFSLKGPQYITHIRRLKEVEEPLNNFLASGLLCLKEKLGPILWQFPPSFVLKDDRVERFIRLLPRTSADAVQAAARHGRKVEGRAWLEAGGDYPLRHAFEFRHPSFANRDFISMLREYQVAIVFAHAGAKSPYIEDVTSDFIYARMHGEDKAFKKKGYTEKVLDGWIERLKLWMAGKQPADAACLVDKAPAERPRDAYIYFDNEEKVHAPHDAIRLLKKWAS